MLTGVFKINPGLSVETIEDNLIVKKGSDKIDLLLEIYNNLKARNFYSQSQSKLEDLFGIEKNKLIMIKKLILSKTYGDDFNPEKHKKLLKEVILELDVKSADNKLFTSDKLLRTFLVSSFNAKHLAQNLKVQHISCKSLCLYIHGSKLLEKMRIEAFTCNKIKKMINNFFFKKKLNFNEIKPNFEKSHVQDVLVNWKEHQADYTEVMEAIFDPTVQSLEDGFFEEVLKFHPRPSQESPPIKKNKI